jgi:hypothetical protein
MSVNVNKQLKRGSTRLFFYFDKTTEQVTTGIIQLETILLIYKVLQHQDESFLLTYIVIHLQFNINDRHISLILMLFCRNKKITLWNLFLIVYLHLQWNAVLTQIMLCLAEAVLRNSRFLREPY